jgi:hypothetical protein
MFSYFFLTLTKLEFLAIFYIFIDGGVRTAISPGIDFLPSKEFCKGE